ncbi:MAG: T9SS type A sorting domain-containing protein [Bacteroidia bacterium]
MKTFLLSASALMLSLTTFAQDALTHQQVSAMNQRSSAATAETHFPAFAPPAVPLYSNDVIIDPQPAVDQSKVRLAVAFNGWLYAAYSFRNPATNEGGMTILRSRTNGQTWIPMNSISFPLCDLSVFDITVAGTDTTNLILYITGSNRNTSTGDDVLYVDKYNATTGAFIAENYSLPRGTANKINGISIATDYTHPAVGVTGYSIGIAYTTFQSSSDSVIYIASIDGGNTFTEREVVATTGFYTRHVSISYGRSVSGSNGRYFVAWERLPSGSARTGNIYVSRNTSSVDGGFITPKNLDSISSAAIGVCAYPEIATSFDTEDSDSSGVSAVVLVQRDYSTNGTDYDAIGFYNKRSHFTNFWYRLDVVNSTENDLYPHISYDPANNNFLTTYYDSTNGKLPYVINNFNLVNPNTWTVINQQYNDVTTNLKKPLPRVEINPLVTGVAHAWIAQGSSNNGVAMFDAEYVITGIQQAGQISSNELYPNPATQQATLSYTVSVPASVRIALVNMVGQEVEVQNIERTAGNFQTTFDVSALPAGIYFVSMTAGNNVMTKRLVVTH